MNLFPFLLPYSICYILWKLLNSGKFLVLQASCDVFAFKMKVNGLCNAMTVGRCLDSGARSSDDFA